MMKLYVVLSVVVVGAFALNRLEEVGECIDQRKIEKERIKAIICEGPNNENEECFLACALKKIDMMNAEGKFNLEKAKKEIEECKDIPPEHKVTALKHLDECFNVDCSGECKCAAAAMKCMMEKFKGNACSMVLPI